MPVVLPQQFLSLLVRNLSNILTIISILPKVPARLKLPEHRQQMIVTLRRSESKNPLTIARRVDERGDVQLRIVGDIDEVLRRERQELVLTSVGTDDPICSAIACFSEASAVVDAGEDGGGLEWWVG